MSRLVAYFSYSGATRRKAEQISEEVSAPLFEIRAKVPYTAADVNWQNKQSRNVLEYQDKSSRPEIDRMPDLTGVDEIWVGYPIWWYTNPRIINTFFDQADLKGKTVHLFATSSSTGIEGSMKELRETYPDVQIADGRRV